MITKIFVCDKKQLFGMDLALSRKDQKKQNAKNWTVNKQCNLTAYI